MKKRIASVILALCMTLSLLPVSVWAEEAVSDGTSLQNTINSGSGTVKLTADVDLAGKSLTIPADREITLDLNGHQITASVSPVVAVEGKLTVTDSTTNTAPVVADDDTVTYSFGSITTGDGRRDAVRVRNGGTFTLEKGTVKGGNIAVCADGVINGTGTASTAVIKGGYVEAQEAAVLVRGKGARADIEGGVLLSRDNAVVSGNGQPKYAGTEIHISGGTLIGKITTPGYIACGIYHPQEGELEITGGDIRAVGGAGIVMRGGKLDMRGGTVTATEESKSAGWVGDKKSTIAPGRVVVVEVAGGGYAGGASEIRGGSFSARPDADCLAPDYKLQAVEVDGKTVYQVISDTYTVTFALNYTGAPAAETTQVENDGKVTKPANPTRTDYTFGGWYKQADCTDEWDFDKDTVTGDTTLYAKWTKDTDNPDPGDTEKKYTVKFNTQGGSAVADQSITQGGKVTRPANPTRTGYTFGGWYKEAACTTAWNFSTDTVTADTTLYARWTQDTTPPADGRYYVYSPGYVSGGRVDVSHSTAAPGTRVTIELRPWSDYELDWLTVTNLRTGRTVSVTERYSDEYTFIMPSGDVEVEVSFYDRYAGRYYGGTHYVSDEAPAKPKPIKWRCSGGSIYHVTDGLVPYGTPLTRDMLISILYDMDPASSGDPTIWAGSKGIIPDIYMSVLWGVDKPITREQTAMILYCYARHMGYGTSQSVSLDGYADYGQIRDIARPAMSWARAAGLISGTSATTLSPQSVLTCEQAGAILSRFSANVARTWQ